MKQRICAVLFPMLFVPAVAMADDAVTTAGTE